MFGVNANCPAVQGEGAQVGGAAGGGVVLAPPQPGGHQVGVAGLVLPSIRDPDHYGSAWPLAS